MEHTVTMPRKLNTAHSPSNWHTYTLYYQLHLSIYSYPLRHVSHITAILAFCISLFTIDKAVFMLFIHSVVCLASGPQSLPQPVLHKMRASASSFNFHYPLFSLRSSSCCLRLLSRLPITFILPSYLSSNNVFQKAVPTQRANNPVSLPSFLLYVRHSSPPWLFLTLFHLSNDRSNWPSPSFSSTTFQNFPRISVLLSEVSKFQHQTKLHSRCANGACLSFGTGIIFF